MTFQTGQKNWDGGSIYIYRYERVCYRQVFLLLWFFFFLRRDVLRIMTFDQSNYSKFGTLKERNDI